MKRLFTALIALTVVIPALAQEKPPVPDPAKAPAQAQAAQAKPDAPPAKPQESEPKPYDKVVTADFKTQAGVVKAHTSKGKLLLEIPPSELGKDFLLVVQIKKSPSASSYPGQGVDDMVVRWELRENKVLLRGGLLRQHRRSQRSDQEGGRCDEHTDHDDGLQRRGPGRGRRPGHRRDEALHHGRQRDPGEEGESADRTWTPRGHSWKRSGSIPST